MSMITRATSFLKRSAAFLKEVFAELGKVVWPSRPELIGASIIVVLLALFFAVILGGMDSGFGTIVKYIIG